MQTFWQIIIIALMLFAPWLMVILARKFKFLGLLGPIFLCYLLGFLLSFVLPETGFAMNVAEMMIPVAIPLILFTADLASVKRLAKPALISFILLTITVCLVSAADYFIFKGTIPIANKLSGMAVGVYVGGTPNLMAIGVATNVSQTDIVLANTSDMIVGGIYFFLLLSVMPRLVYRFLPKMPYAQAQDPNLENHLEEEFIPGKQVFSIKAAAARLPVIFLGLACLAVSAGIALLITGQLDVTIIMLVVTALGIGFSFVRRIRNAPGSYATGQYLIYMFSIGIGLSFKLTDLSYHTLLILAFFAIAQFGSIIFHLIFARIFRIDGAIALITSTAGIYGPAFIIPAANALKNREVILPGLICGILGLAVGNFLGIGVALLLGVL